jgi:outer membrane protein TolC
MKSIMQKWMYSQAVATTACNPAAGTIEDGGWPAVAHGTCNPVAGTIGSGGWSAVAHGICNPAAGTVEAGGTRRATSILWLIVITLMVVGSTGIGLPVQAQIQTTPHSSVRGSDTGWSVPDFADHQADTLLTWYLHAALTTHPAVMAANERYQASLTLGEQGAALPDPEVMIGYFLNPMAYDGVLGQATLGVMQMFPWPGTRNDARLYGDQRAEAELASLMLTQLELMTRVRESWYSMVELYRREGWLQEHHSWVVQLERLTLTRFESGYASRADLLRLEIERTSLSADLSRLRIELGGAVEAFNTLLGRDPTALIQWPQGRPEASFEPRTEHAGASLIRSDNNSEAGFAPSAGNNSEAGFAPSADNNSEADFTPSAGEFLTDVDQSSALEALSPWAYHPRLARSTAQIEASQTAVRQARRMGMPMIGLGAEIMGPNYVMSMPGNRVPVVAQVSLRLPVWRKAADARVEQARALERASRYEHDLVAQSLQEDYARAISSYNSISEEIRLLREELLPRSRELTDLLVLDFSGGRARLDEVIGVRRSTVNLSLRLERAVRDRNLAASRLQLIAPEMREPSDGGF